MTMDGTSRDKFSSSFGFVMSAAGSAIGLGNIWAFPTKTAENGGAAFVIFYIFLAFFVGYPILLAEFTLGRHTQSNPVGAYQKVRGGKLFIPAGFLSLIIIGFILSFYSIIAGSMIAHFLEPIFHLLNGDVAAWVTASSIYARMLFSSLFFFFTIFIVMAGVSNGIEKWSVRLMPTLLIMLVLLIVYVLTLEGAMEGVKKYLIPDFSKVVDPTIFLSAMGQAFFSLSLGVGSMLVYASYTSKKENLLRLGILVTLCDVGIAFLAGLLIIPAMYAAAASNMTIVDGTGHLISGPDLIFQILPTLFDRMGNMGIIVSMVFFFLMVIASLTSTISMLEVPVSYVVDNRKVSRQKATVIIGLMCWVVSMAIILNFNWLFNSVVTITTQYAQPIVGLLICLFVGWVMHRDTLIQELKQGNSDIENSLFIKIWPWFVKIVSPALIFLVFLQSFLPS